MFGWPLMIQSDMLTKVMARNTEIAAMRLWRRYGICAACRAEQSKPCRDQRYPADSPPVYLDTPHGVRELVA